MKDFNMVEYLKEVDNARKIYPSWRYGQALFNELYRVKPEWANEVCGTEADPFYQDVNIDKFWKWLANKV